jgi:hypothetical protein
MICSSMFPSSSLAILALYTSTTALDATKSASNSMILAKGSIGASVFGMLSLMVGPLSSPSCPQFLLQWLEGDMAPPCPHCPHILRMFSNIFPLMVASIRHLSSRSQSVCSSSLEVFDHTTLVLSTTCLGIFFPRPPCRNFLLGGMNCSIGAIMSDLG